MKKFILLGLLVLTAACNERAIYSETDSDFSDNRWLKSDQKTYEFTLPSEQTPYAFEVYFSHVFDYQFASVPLIVELTHPDGQLESVAVNLELKDSNGSELGDCSGDICDVTQPVVFKRALKAGNYKARLMHNFNSEYLPNVLGVGIRVNQLAD